MEPLRATTDPASRLPSFSETKGREGKEKGEKGEKKGKEREKEEGREGCKHSIETNIT